MKSQWTLSIEKNTDNFHYKWMSPIHSLSMEGRHATVTYCRPHFRRYNLFHYSCVCFIWKMLWSFFSSSQKNTYFLISLSPYLKQHPFLCCHQLPCLPRQGLPRLNCYFKSIKERHTQHSHTVSPLFNLKSRANVDGFLRMKWAWLWLTAPDEIQYYLEDAMTYSFCYTQKAIFVSIICSVSASGWPQTGQRYP